MKRMGDVFYFQKYVVEIKMFKKFTLKNISNNLFFQNVYIKFQMINYDS